MSDAGPKNGDSSDTTDLPFSFMPSPEDMQQ